MPVTGAYPTTRLRRLRRHEWSRDLVAEHSLSVKDLIWPLFICEEGMPLEVASMPGVTRYTLKTFDDALKQAHELKIPALALFPVIDPKLKCDQGLEGTNSNNLLCQAIRMAKENYPDIGIITDVALDPYTTHGHDGVVIDGDVANDETIEILNRCAIAQAQAGSDVVAPSDMMDGRIGAIRTALDSKGFQKTMILSYTAKYASGFYGPFRDALGSGSNLGKKGKHTYQMHAANRNEALREGLQDIEEGADILMVKPGLPYLDIVRDLKSQFHMPTFVYHVSGEYAMLKAASQNGWLDYDRTLMETMLSFKRAGADAILSYAAPDVARLLLQ